MVCSFLFPTIYSKSLVLIHKKMTREEREALSQRICNFYYDPAKKSVKTTLNYFKKQNVPQSTIYYVLKKYLLYGITKDLL